MLGKKVASEVNHIMGPSTPGVSYSTPTHTLTNSFGSSQIPRQPKHKSKCSIVSQKYGIKKPSRKSVSTFQKKLYVFEYMGTNPLRIFTRSDNRICISGLLPSSSIKAGEAEICDEICALIHSCSYPSYREIAPTDFEFINMNGKSICSTM